MAANILNASATERGLIMKGTQSLRHNKEAEHANSTFIDNKYNYLKRM